MLKVYASLTLEFAANPAPAICTHKHHGRVAGHHPGSLIDKNTSMSFCHACCASAAGRFLVKLTLTVTSSCFEVNRMQDTGDTRETPAIDVCRGLLRDKAHLNIYDPKVLY